MEFKMREMTKEESLTFQKAINELFEPTGRNILEEEPDKTICPRCHSDETFSINDFLEYALEYRECEHCGCEYEVHFTTIVKDIKIRK